MRRTARPWNIEITVEGLNIERFVRQAGEQDIRLSSMRRQGRKRLTALVQEDQLPQLQELAIRGGWKISRGGRHGLGIAAEWLRRRWLLAAMILIACTALIMASQGMWQVEIIGAGTYQADIERAIIEQGIKPPMLRKTVDIGALREALEWRYPRVAWFEVGWRGTTLVVRMVEGVLPRQDAMPHAGCDVVAARDAIVQQVVTNAGTPVVQPGDFVRKGDVLIRGEERTSDGAVKPVAASGSVTGRIWRGALVEMPTIETMTEYTGNSETAWTVRTPWFDLWQMEGSPYEVCDVAVSEQPICGIFLPIKLYVETRHEATISTKRRPFDDIRAEAEQAALRKLHEKLHPEESLIDIWGNCSMIDNEKVQSLAIGELLVEIGVQQVSTGMAAPAGENSE